MSNTVIIAGNPKPIEMPARQVWRITDGYSYERRWWGPADAVRAMFNPNNKTGTLVGATGITFDQQSGSPIGILTATYTGNIITGAGGSGQQTVMERMTVKFSDQTVKIDRNPAYIDISNAAILAMEELLKTGAANTQTADSADFDYYDLRSRGVENYRLKLPVVTWTRTVGDRYPTNLDLELAGLVLSTSELVDVVGAPVLFDIPAANVGVREASGWTAGWFMDAQMDYTGDGKIEMTIAGEFGLWENSLYEIGMHG